MTPIKKPAYSGLFNWRRSWGGTPTSMCSRSASRLCDAAPRHSEHGQLSLHETSSGSAVDYDDSPEAAEIVLLADLLMRELDRQS